MPNSHPLSGVYAAAATPLHPNGQLDSESIPRLLDFLARRGCHGALLFGTTGEGPSFAPDERMTAWRAALTIRQLHPNFRLLAGTGTPSLEETIGLTRTAFDLGLDGVVVLPPYYYRKINDDGLFAWFSELIRRGAPSDGAVLAYHIPPVTGVPISLDLLARLKDAFPRQFAGLKDSSGDGDHARSLGERFRSDLLVLTGNDRLLSYALQNFASGCITAMANLYSPELRRVWDAYRAGGDAAAPIALNAQADLDAARTVMDGYSPAPALIKAALHARYGFPLWPVRPPLLPLAAPIVQEALAALDLHGSIAG